MKKIINPKYILYMVLPVAAIVLSILFLLGESIVNYAVGGVLCASGIGLSLYLFLFVPHSYIIDKDGIKTFYRIKSCNLIPWGVILTVLTRALIPFMKVCFSGRITLSRIRI